jgi:hypothetical protein
VLYLAFGSSNTVVSCQSNGVKILHICILGSYPNIGTIKMNSENKLIDRFSFFWIVIFDDCSFLKNRAES